MSIRWQTPYTSDTDIISVKNLLRKVAILSVVTYLLHNDHFFKHMMMMVLFRVNKDEHYEKETLNSCCLT